MIDAKSTSIKILADDRERQGGIPEILCKYENITVEITRLTVGDYLINDSVVIERKTLNDLIQSIIDGRIFSQATKLVSSVYKPVIILEGTSKDIATRKMSRETIQGTIVNLSLIMGIPILRSKDKDETAKLIIYSARQLLSTISTVNRHGYKPKGKRKKQLYILQGLPGIGRKRAELLLEKFQSVQTVFNADQDALASIEGIGRKTAENIRNCVCEGESIYNYTMKSSCN